MATAMRVTGAWVQLLTDWLDRENLPAPALRTVLDSRSPADLVPLPLWRDLLQQAVALRPDRVTPGLSIGAMVQPRHVGMLGYLILTCRTLGEAMQAEGWIQAECMKHPDYRESYDAFVEKRPKDFVKNRPGSESPGAERDRG